MALKDRYRQKVPEWLASIDLDKADPLSNIEFPLQNVLARSLYYPACGFDGRPVQFLGGVVHSFVYADYGVTKLHLMEDLNKRGCTGYRLAGCKSLKKNDIAPHGGNARDLEEVRWQVGETERRPPGRWVQRFFAEWMIFQRLPGFDEFHGPERFSLLFICADGVATYLDLYVGNRVVPLVLAIIQPGTGFGGNYTDFRDPNGLLAHVVLKMNNGRVPDYMVCGQIGPLDQTHAFWQMEYPEHVEYFQHRNGVGVWRRWELTQSDDL